MIKNPNQIHKTKLRFSDRMALEITNKIGTMAFFGVIFCWTLIWLLWNSFAPEELRFDESPDFLTWLFISNMIQLFLLPLLLISQNIQGKHAELTADNDYKIDLKTEEEMELLHIKIDALTLKIEQLQKLVAEK